MAKSKTDTEPTGEALRKNLRQYVDELQFDAPVKQINAMISAAMKETDSRAWLFEQITKRQGGKPAEAKADPPPEEDPPKQPPPEEDPPEQPPPEVEADSPAAAAPEKPLIQRLAELADELGFAGDVIQRGKLIEAAINSGDDPFLHVSQVCSSQSLSAARPGGVQIPEAARSLHGQPPLPPAASALKPDPPAAGTITEVPIVVPLAPLKAEAYAQRHIELNLDAAQTKTFRRLMDGLDRSGARLAADDKRVISGADGIRWLLEAIARSEPPLEKP